jgi:hypothetical protein
VDKQKIVDKACTVDHVEEVTGINFFPSLPDPEEDRLESKMDINL